MYRSKHTDGGGTLDDLTGQKFGLLTVVCKQKDSAGRNGWLCKCDCGGSKVVKGSDLKRGSVKSCGCLFAPDLTGKQFGFLTVVKETDKRTSWGARIWECRCICGKTMYVCNKYLTTGVTKSCGCKRKELHNESPLVTKHNMCYSRIYRVWSEMRNRCENPNNSVYKDYGGRGISVCPEWASFQVFYDWATANGYTDDLTIDRIDVNEGYNPENCRWATMKQQANNKRTSKYLQWNGETHTYSEWSEITGLSKTVIRERINKGWSIEEALSTPAIPGGKIRHDGFGRTYTFH